SRKTPNGTRTLSSTSIFMGTMGRESAPAIKRDGPAWSPSFSSNAASTAVTTERKTYGSSPTLAPRQHELQALREARLRPCGSAGRGALHELPLLATLGHLSLLPPVLERNPGDRTGPKSSQRNGQSPRGENSGSQKAS